MLLTTANANENAAVIYLIENSEIIVLRVEY